MRHRFGLPAAAALAALLAACGGGGSDPDAFGTAPAFDPAPGVEFNPLAAWSNFLTTSRTWQVSGIGSDGVNYGITIATAGAGPAVFPVTGLAGTASLAQVSTAGAGFINTVLQRTFFDPGTLQITGLASQLNGGPVACDVALSADVPPTAASIPSSGLLALLDPRPACDPALPDASGTTLEIRWSLDHEAGVDLFCVHTRERNLQATDTFLEIDCVEVAPDGTLGDDALVVIEDLRTGFTLEARSF